MRVLLAAPAGAAYGELGRDWAAALAEARRRGVPIFLLRPVRPVSPALFDLECDGVRVLAPTMLRRWLFGAWWRLAAVRTSFRDALARFDASILRSRTSRLRKLMLAVDADERSKPLRVELKARIQELEASGASTEAADRTIAGPGVTLRLRDDSERRALDAARRAGIDLDRPMVTVHVREAGWFAGGSRPLRHDPRQDAALRNATIETHAPAIAYLVAQGYTVVRLGDSSMAPLRWPGVVDLATADPLDDRLQLACLMRSRFLLGGDSGPAQIAGLVSTPALTVNVTDPLGAWPSRADGLYLLKTVIDRQTGQPLPPLELASDRYLDHVGDTMLFRYVENTPGQILAAVREMLDGLGRREPAREPQQEYRRALVAAARARGVRPGAGRLARAAWEAVR
jgi:putative glycosyltransferase (TIGR04372 family)